MSDDFDQFRHVLFHADEELQWGADPERVEAAAQALRQVSPSCALVHQLELKAARLRKYERREPCPFRTRLNS